MINQANTSPEFQQLFGNYQTATTNFINANDALESARANGDETSEPDMVKVADNYRTACQAELDTRQADCSLSSTNGSRQASQGRALALANENKRCAGLRN